MSPISATMAARSNTAAGAGPTISSGRLLATSQSPSSASSPLGSAPLWAPPAPEAAPAATKKPTWATAKEEATGEAAVPQEAAAEEAGAPEALVAAVAGMAVAAVQVQH